MRGADPSGRLRGLPAQHGGRFLIVGGVAGGAVLAWRRNAAAVTVLALLVLFALVALAQKILILINVEYIHLVQLRAAGDSACPRGTGRRTVWLTATVRGAGDEGSSTSSSGRIG